MRQNSFNYAEFALAVRYHIQLAFMPAEFRSQHGASGESGHNDELWNNETVSLLTIICVYECVCVYVIIIM